MVKNFLKWICPALSLYVNCGYMTKENEKKPENTYKRTYHLPKPLMDFFAEWCKPGRDYSTKVSGAILHYMSLEPNTRRSCEESAFQLKDKKDIKAEVENLASSRFRSEKEGLLPLPEILQQIQQHASIVSETRSATKRTKNP